MRYRYIGCDTAVPNDKLKDLKLISSNGFYGTNSIIRVEIPDYIKLTKLRCNFYSTADDTEITLRELNPKVIVRFNGRCIVDDALTALWLSNKIEPRDFHKNLNKCGFTEYIRFGYLNSEQLDFIHAIEYRDHKKIWQLDKIPKSRKEWKGFIPHPKYKKIFKSILPGLRNVINSDEEIKKLMEELHFSEEDALDLYGYHCFKGYICREHCYDTKMVQDIESTYFAYTLKDYLQCEKDTKELMTLMRVCDTCSNSLLMLEDMTIVHGRKERI